MDLGALSDLPYCYLTTTGRKSGQPREIEIWFGLGRSTLYLLAGGRETSHWVRNIAVEPRVQVRLGSRTFSARGRAVGPGTAEERDARDQVFAKYQGGYSGDLSDWRERALVMALDIEHELDDAS